MVVLVNVAVEPVAANDRPPPSPVAVLLLNTQLVRFRVPLRLLKLSAAPWVVLLALVMVRLLSVSARPLAVTLRPGTVLFPLMIVLDAPLPVMVRLG